MTSFVIYTNGVLEQCQNKVAYGMCAKDTYEHFQTESAKNNRELRAEQSKKGLTLTRKFVPKSPVAEFEATDFEAALLHYRQWKKEQGEHVQDG